MGDSMFSLGNVVVVKNTTVRMTVEGIVSRAGCRFIACVWFDAEDHLHHATFNEKVLTLVEV